MQLGCACAKRRVFVAVVHNSDFTLLLRAAARHQVAGRGFAWLHAGKLDEGKQSIHEFAFCARPCPVLKTGPPLPAIGLANVMDDAEELSEAMVLSAVCRRAGPAIHLALTRRMVLLGGLDRVRSGCDARRGSCFSSCVLC